jgi:putative endonuclease
VVIPLITGENLFRKSGIPYTHAVFHLPSLQQSLAFQMPYYTYILTNKWKTVLYIGMTNNIQRRTFEHKARVNKSFTSRFNCDRLVYYEEFRTPMQAIRREKYLKKKFSRRMKEELINSLNPQWLDLSDGWFDPKEFELYRRMKNGN